MYRISAYISLIIILLFNSPLLELHKLPVLFQHFWEHQQRDSSTGLLDFLSMHYWGKDINDNDHERDMELPFKQISINTLTVFAVDNQYTALKHNNFYRLTITYPLLDDNFLPQSFISTLFRPPQV